VDIIITLMPLYVDGYLVRMLYSREGRNTGVTSLPFFSEIIPTHIKKENIKDIFDPHGYPILAKNFSNIDQDHIVSIMTEGNKGKKMRMLSYEGHNQPHISPSCAIYKTAEQIAFDDYSTKFLFENVSHNHSPLYAGFETITDPEIIKDITGVDFTTLGDYKQNNLFASNFDRETFTATMHCAPIDSFSLQLVGTKTWFFVSPDDLANIPSIPLPTSFNLPMTDDQLLSRIKNVIVVKQEPGDALYFGPHWCHAVSTSPGPNIMFNMRYFVFDKLKNNPLHLFIKIVIRKFNRVLGENPQDNLNQFPIIFSDLNNYFLGKCGPSKAFNAILRRYTGAVISDEE
jgi:hypothetical protein